MSDIGQQFRSWVLAQRPAYATPVKADEDHIRIETPHATAEVNFYPYANSEIVEYRITPTDGGDPTFFLHFVLDDLERAQDLFGQMGEALADERHHTTTHVLLSCTSALTTTLFAAKMRDVAKALSLDYDFCALSVERALVTTDDYTAILLAPQVAHLRKQMMEAHPNAIVFEIPAKIFGSYDAVAAFRLLMHALRDTHGPSDDAPELRAVRKLADKRRVLIITLFLFRDTSRLGYRIYDCGKPAGQGVVQKPRLDFRDIEDLIESLFAREPHMAKLDAIGIAVPGVTRRGMVTLPSLMEESYDLGVSLSHRFGLPVYVDNNCNAAAVGCYMSQEDYESLVFFRQALGHLAGGFGTVIDGRLLKGRSNLAGEPKYFESRIALTSSYEEALWSANGLHEIAQAISLAAISLIAPEAVYLAVDTVDDAEEFRASLATELGWEYTPPVHIVTDYIERVYLGELAMALQKLRDPRYRSLGVGA